MRRFAIIIDGVVENITLWDGVTPWEPYGEAVDVTDMFCDIGMFYRDGAFFREEEMENNFSLVNTVSKPVDGQAEEPKPDYRLAKVSTAIAALGAAAYGAFHYFS